MPIIDYRLLKKNVSEGNCRINLCIFLTFLLFTSSSLWAKAPEKEKKDQTTKTRHIEVPTEIGKLHFELHFVVGDVLLANRVEQILKEDTPAISKYFKHVPKNNVHLVINDATSANGMATVFPRNIIFLNNFPPQGNQHLIVIDDWLRGLIIHEFTHILHLDQTRGLPKVLTSIFGSIGKLGGVTPRWFAEGIAVWAETHFTAGGRLRNPLMLHQFEQSFFQENACLSIDCVNNPNHYPYAQYGYWAGAYFLSLLEKEKEGVISCLVRENSKELPGFLNLAFKRCTNHTAPELYEKFVDKIIEKNKIVKNISEIPNYQKNHLIVKDQYLSIYNIEKRDYFVTENLKNRNKEFSKLSPHVDELLFPTTFSESKNRIFFIGFDAPMGRGRPKVFSLDIKSKETKIIDLDKTYLYFYEIAEDHYLGIVYEDSQFILYEVENNLEEKERFKFPVGVHLHHFDLSVKNNKAIFYALMTENNQHEMISFHFDLESKNLDFYKILKSKTPIKQIGQFENTMILDTQDGRDLYILGTNHVEKFNVKEQAETLIDVRGNNNYCSYLSNKKRAPSLLGFQGNCEKLKEGNLLKLALHSFTFTEQKAELSSRDESYPSLRHFTPRYWLLNYHVAEKIDVWSVLTSINDPKSIHNLSLSVDFYPRYSKSAPQFTYTVKTGPVFWTLDSTRSYIQNSLNDEIDTFKSQGIAVGSMLPLGSLLVRPNIFYTKQTIEDFISNRELDQYGLSLNFFKDRMHVDSFWQKFNFFIKAYRQKNKTGEAFYGGQTKLENTFRLAKNLHFNTVGSHGRLYKNDFRSGVIYAGGSNSQYPQAFHEFYGVNYTDIFGRKISSARAELEYLFYSPYSAGGGLAPFYLKDVSLLGGFNIINAERIFVDNRVLRDAELKSVHMGLRFSADLMYLLPFEMDLIYSKVLEYDEGQMMLLFRGSIFP